MDGDDLEQMEIDDEGGFSQEGFSPVPKRFSSGAEKHPNDLKNLPASLPTLSKRNETKRTFLKAKRNTNRLPSKCSTTCVLDTNILLEDLTLIKTIIVNRKNPLFYRSDRTAPIIIDRIIVPWIVIQELDGLKKSADQIKEANNAIRFINEQFKNNGLIKGENSIDAVCSIEEHSNDDKILNCCLNLNQKYASSSDLLPSTSNEVDKTKPNLMMKVILITNDCNLQNKALIHNIEALSIDEFRNKYFNLKMFQSSASSSQNDNTALTPSSNQSHKKPIVDNEDYYYQSECRPRKFLKNENRLSQQVALSPSSKALVDEIRRNLSVKNKKLDHVKNTNQSPQCSSTSSISAQPTQSSNVSSDESPESNINARYKLETVLVPLIVDQYSSIFGDPFWRKMIPNFKPKSSSLYDCLQVIKKNWIGVFSDYFNRNRQVRDLVNDILERLKPSHHATTNNDSDNNNTSNVLVQKCQQLLKQIDLYRAKKHQSARN